MEQRPLISVIVPVYNIKEYLPRCVESVLQQSYRNLELILVDDGSTDGTGALCDALSKTDERIRVYHKENGGSSSARNLGISKAQGKYLGFVDSDDYISADMYERLVKALEEKGAGIAQIGRDEVDESGKRLPDVCIPPKEDIWISAPDFMKELLMHRGDCSYCTKLVDRSLFDQERFPMGVLNEDFHLLVQMLLKVEGILSLSGVGYHVFYRIGSNTRKEDKNHFSRVFGDNVDNADMVLGIVSANYPSLVDIARRFGLFQRLDYMLHIPIGQMTAANKQYKSISAHIRRNIFDGIRNPYLTKKNKIYLVLFAIAPKTVRRVHRFLMGLR